ncbi:uncharacterized protein LOC113333224 [Papaver somniferum]|uniref:uncharacterized protein LOC113333224 n=1 Tax=Papaver somniferum TaxID=3469 RepID=UPI000E70118F|nr:uncharacterized protein LOC113333224 [Papaver somniferum]
MQDVNNICIFCNDKIESVHHLLFDCWYAKSVWMQPPFAGGTTSNIVRNSFINHFNCWQSQGDKVIEINATKCWFIWKEMCNRIFEEKNVYSLQTSIIIHRHLNFWNCDTRNIITTNGCNVTKKMKIVPWKCPEHNCFKLNYDASWISESVYAVFGLIIRDHAGNGRAAKSGVFYAASAEKAEALALLYGARWAKDADLAHFWIEGDVKGS